MLPTMSTRPNSDCGAVDERVDVGALGDVDAPHDRGAAVGLDLVGGRLRAGLVDVATDDRGARRREHARGRLADPAPDAGEHRDPAREVEQILHAGSRHSPSTVGRIAIVGRGAY